MAPRVALVSLITATAAPGANAQSIVVEDLTGRRVELETPAKRLIIDDARYLVALSLIHESPVSVLAGWPHDSHRLGGPTYARYVAAFPRLAKLAKTSSSAGTFSLEAELAARPDVAIYTMGRGPTAAQRALLERAGVKVLFLDFVNQPFEHLEESLRVLGAVVGRSAQAKEFLAYRRAHMARIAGALEGITQRPSVFLEAHAGISDDCCNSPGKGNIGDYIEFAGGHNIGADVLPGPMGKLNLEYVVACDPDVYIATGGPHLERTGGLVVGDGYTAEQARAALRSMSNRRGIADLSAVREGRVYGLSHQLLNSPLDLLAVETLARWIHPELFRDVDPARTMVELNSRFLAVPLEGAHWVTLR